MWHVAAALHKSTSRELRAASCGLRVVVCVAQFQFGKWRADISTDPFGQRTNQVQPDLTWEIGRPLARSAPSRSTPNLSLLQLFYSHDKSTKFAFLGWAWAWAWVWVGARVLGFWVFVFFCFFWQIIFAAFVLFTFVIYLRLLAHKFKQILKWKIEIAFCVRRHALCPNWGGQGGRGGDELRGKMQQDAYSPLQQGHNRSAAPAHSPAPCRGGWATCQRLLGNCSSRKQQTTDGHHVDTLSTFIYKKKGPKQLCSHLTEKLKGKIAWDWREIESGDANYSWHWSDEKGRRLHDDNENNQKTFIWLKLKLQEKI